MKLDEAKSTAFLAVDGGINEDTAPIAKKAGANFLVTGSALFQSPDYHSYLTTIRT